jgi:non-homologous end joining protein Ku
VVESKIKGEKIEAAPEPKPRGQVIDLMEALKKSLAGNVGQQHKKKVATRRIEKGFSFSEFKTVMAD